MTTFDTPLKVSFEVQDDESGVSRVQWCIADVDQSSCYGDLQPYTDVDVPNTAAGADLIFHLSRPADASGYEGLSIIYWVRVTNGAGLTTDAKSAAAIERALPPLIEDVINGPLSGVRQ